MDCREEVIGTRHCERVVFENLEESECGEAEQDIRVLAGLPVGRVGSLFSCVSFLPFGRFCCSSAPAGAFLFSRPPGLSATLALSLSPTSAVLLLRAPSSTSSSSSSSSSASSSRPYSLRRVVVRLFYYFYKRRRHHQSTGASFVGPPGASGSAKVAAASPIVAREKMRILIWHCL